MQSVFAYGQASVNVGHYFFFRFFLLPCLFGLAGSFLGANALMAIDQESSSKTEEVASLKISGGVRYLSSSRAELRWESNLKGAAVVAYGVDKTLGTLVESKGVGTSHSVILEDLDPDMEIYYRIAVKHTSGRKISEFYRVEPGMNYRLPSINQDSPIEGWSERSKFATSLESIVPSLSGIVVLDGQLADSCLSTLLRNGDISILVGFDRQDALQEFRQASYRKGIYGVHVSAQLFRDLPSEFANCVITSPAGLERSLEWLSPSGKLVCQSAEQPTDVSYRGEKVVWSEVSANCWLGVQTSLEKLSEWGHQYGSPANASYVGESLGGVDDTSELEVRWLGRPGADFGIDRNPRMPAPLVTGGRLFHQGMNRMVAVDAFNGAILWSLEIPKLRRVNIPRDSGNWCADEDRVYAAVGDRLWVIDAATGEMLHTVEPPEGYQDGFDWGYVAATEDFVVGTVVPSGGIYEEFWDKPSWYDGINDTAAAKVCGRNLMVYDKKYGDLIWQRVMDSVLHSTITIHEDKLYFVEVDDPELGQQAIGRLSDAKIWSKASVVCVDLKTGEENWKVQAPATSKVEVIAFGVADANQFVLETSSGGKFHLASFDAKTGEKRWEQSPKWSEDNHGGHMQHAVLMDGKIFLQPSILDASNGEIIKTDTLGKRRGCATPIGAGGSIIYRGGTGPVTLWSLEGEKTSEFARLRPSCWLSTIPAHGMLYSPEAGGGCSCGGWMECSIGFAPLPSTASQDVKLK